MTDKRKTLFLIDVAGLVYRFFYTLPTMTAPDGAPTNAAFGFARTLLALNRDYNPDFLVPAMESRTPTFRHQMYPEYKAHRDKMPDNLRAQIPIVEQIITAMGLTPAQADGFEADDIIGTMARSAARNDIDVFIITGDRDMLQLVDDHIHVLMCIKGTSDLEDYDSDKITQRMGVPPHLIVDLKALEGDKSDNIPGVPGIGNKTAVQLLKSFSSVEDIYSKVDQIEKKVLKTKLLENENLAHLSKRLATIECNAPIDLDLSRFAFDPAKDRAALADLFHRYSFHSLIKDLGLRKDLATVNNAQLSDMSISFTTIFDENHLISFLDSVISKGKLCLDLETTGLDTIEDMIVGVSLAYEPGSAVYVPIRHKIPDKPAYSGDIFGEQSTESNSVDDVALSLVNKQIAPDRALEILKPVLENEQISKLGHNLKFDMTMLMSAGIELKGIHFDSMIASYLLDPSSRSHSLKTIAGQRLGMQFKSYEDIVGKGKEQICFSEVPIHVATEYACFDVDLVLRMEQNMLSQLEHNGLMSVFENLEIPLINVLAHMEFVGVSVDENLLKLISIEMTAQEASIIEQVRKLTHMEINLNSPKQIAELLFDKLGLTSVKKRSTDINVLEELQFSHDVVPLIIEYRHVTKLKGTYVNALPALVKKRTKRIHTSFNQHITATGRLSSSDPNLQNIPVRSESGRQIRKAFIPASNDYKMITADYSQIEIRLLAELSRDPALVDAFMQGQDIHSRTAAAVFGVDIEDVSKDQRRFAKTINFGLIYGMREFNLARTLGISRQEALAFIDNYFHQYPSVQQFIDHTQANAMANGFVTTLFGRRRYVPEVNSPNKNEQQAGFRAAFNTIIQGTAADIIKLAMIQIHDSIKKGLIQAIMILQVHDELVFEAPKNSVPEAGRSIKHIMESCVQSHFDMRVPLIADISIGDNWLETQPL